MVGWGRGGQAALTKLWSTDPARREGPEGPRVAFVTFIDFQRTFASPRVL